MAEALDKVPPRTFLEATAIMNKWLHDIDDAIKKQTVQVAAETAMTSQLETYKVRTELRNFDVNNQSINHFRFDIICAVPIIVKYLYNLRTVYKLVLVIYFRTTFKDI